MKRTRTLAAVLTALAVLAVLVPPAAASGPDGATSPFEGLWSLLESIYLGLGCGAEGSLEALTAAEGAGSDDDWGPIDASDDPDGGPIETGGFSLEWVIAPGDPGTDDDWGPIKETSSTPPHHTKDPDE